LGILWLALGVYTSTEEVADVECDEDSDFSYSSSTYHAQYHVLQAFSLFNTILLWAFLLFFLFLALRHHFTARQEVWTSKVTSYPWLGGAKGFSSQQSSRHPAQLPQPVTSKEKSSKSNGQSSRHGPTVVAPQMPSKGKGGHTYVVFIPPPNASNNTRQQQQQIYPGRR